MRTASPVTRRRLEMQGFTGLDNRALTELAPWLRLTPVICTVWIAVGNLLDHGDPLGAHVLRGAWRSAGKATV